MSPDIAFRFALNRLIIDGDVRRLVKRLADDPRCDAEALLALHDGLLELAEVNAGLGLSAVAEGYRRCAALVSDLVAARPAPEP